MHALLQIALDCVSFNFIFKFCPFFQHFFRSSVGEFLKHDHESGGFDQKAQM